MWEKLSRIQFIKTLDRGECPICKRIEETESTYLEEILMELVDDVKFREKLKSSRGLCLQHFKKMLLLVQKRPELDGIGVSDILRDLVEAEIQDLREVERKLAEIRLKTSMPMDEEWSRILRALKKLFGRI
ncbi:MAG: DUF6062 family protein [Candidatus Bathyarchaeia archaeon]